MDEITAYNIERWQALVEADAVFTRPALNLNSDSAREKIDSEGRLGEIAGKEVLCLACGGGQQSAAFALLGANVTVFDLSEAQLKRDRETADYYGVEIKTIQGDIRNLSELANNSFDIVYHAYSLSFVPNAKTVFQQVGRVVRQNGLYYFNCANPFFLGLGQKDWNGEGYLLKYPYTEGSEVTYQDQEWVYDHNKLAEPIKPPREFRHTLSTIVSGLVETGFIIKHIQDSIDMHPDPKAAPGSWEHFVSFAPPWLGFWTVYLPSQP